jgi:hypothetical protein
MVTVLVLSRMLAAKAASVVRRPLSCRQSNAGDGLLILPPAGTSRRALGALLGKGRIRRDAGPMPALRLVAAFATADDYLAIHEQEVAAGGLLVRGAELPPGTPLTDCTLVVRVEGAGEVELPARLAGAVPGAGVMVIFAGKPEPLFSLASRLRDPAATGEPEQSEQPEAQRPEQPEARERPARPRPPEVITLADKLRLASSCDREQRFAFLRDPNKQLHPMVLKNPRIGLDEVQWAAKLPSINPDALKLIAEHPEWGHNPGVVNALVRNPKTPIPVAIKLLPRLQDAELRVVAKSQGRPQIVAAAKKLVMR